MSARKESHTVFHVWKGGTRQIGHGKYILIDELKGGGGAEIKKNVETHICTDGLTDEGLTLLFFEFSPYSFSASQKVRS